MENFDLLFSLAYIFCGEIVAKKFFKSVAENWHKIASKKVPYFFDYPENSYEGLKCVGKMRLNCWRLKSPSKLRVFIVRATFTFICWKFRHRVLSYGIFILRGNFVVYHVICGDIEAKLSKIPSTTQLSFL